MLCSLLWLQAAGSVSAALTLEELNVWANGPVQWLLLPSERKILRRIETPSEALAFIERFWSRRDPDPAAPGNPYREEFSSRVEAADVLYGEKGRRGSMTDRGRALVLMGPPTNVKVSTEPALAWDPAGEGTDRVTMRRVDVEVWGYRLEDLPAGLVDHWMARKKASEEPLNLTLTFRTISRRTTLVEGEVLLEAAARAAARRQRGD